MSPAGGPPAPAPRAAYGQWRDALGRAGWPGRSHRAGEDGLEQVPLPEALGRVTAAPVAARWASPRAACAAMDGIALRAADLAAEEAGPGDGTGAAGNRGPGSSARHDRAAARLRPGQFRWIDTGDPLPPGADTVVIRERLQLQADGSVLVAPEGRDGDGDGGRDARGRDARGRHVRAAGEDFMAGEVLVPAGQPLRPGDLAAVAAAGHELVTVVRRPVAAIVPTGDEIRTAGQEPRRGEIIDTNSVMLAARCRQLGVSPAVSPVIADDPDALAAELRRVAARADLVLVIAGSSRGRDDHTGAVLAQVGGVAVAGVAVRPGHPALLGQVKRPDAGPGPRAGVVPAIGLPGYPLATAVVFELFAAPLLGELAGRTTAREHARARLDRPWAAPAGTEDWVLVTLKRGPGQLPVATPAQRGASSVSLLARADAWWPIPAGPRSFAAGEEIEVVPID